MTTMLPTSDAQLQRLSSTTLLCLACSSCLPPRSHLPGGDSIFSTPCCSRPICPTCINSNPRLTRYNPCLSCLAGVDAVGSSRKSLIYQNPNIDGGLRDEDAFRIGDDEDEDDETLDNTHEARLSDFKEDKRNSSEPLPGDKHEDSMAARAGSSSVDGTSALPEMDFSRGDISSNPDNVDAPGKYYIQRGDTLNGIALRFNIDVRIFAIILLIGAYFFFQASAFMQAQ
jgi:hypothetical protein